MVTVFKSYWSMYLLPLALLLLSIHWRDAVTFAIAVIVAIIVDIGVELLLRFPLSLLLLCY